MKNKKAIAAAIARHNRRQDRLEHPRGSFDSAGRWYPSKSEATGCEHAREPSRSYPYSQLKAARSLSACAKLEKADLHDCRSTKATLSKRGFQISKMYEATDVLAAMKDGLSKSWTPPEKVDSESDADCETTSDADAEAYRRNVIECVAEAAASLVGRLRQDHDDEMEM